MPKTSTRERKARLSGDRTTFLIHAENRVDVLARVVMLFHRLNVEIVALNMVRRAGSETMRIYVTVDIKRNNCARIHANLEKVVSVTSVTLESPAKELPEFSSFRRDV